MDVLWKGFCFPPMKSQPGSAKRNTNRGRLDNRKIDSFCLKLSRCKFNAGKSPAPPQDDANDSLDQLFRPASSREDGGEKIMGVVDDAGFQLGILNALFKKF